MRVFSFVLAALLAAPAHAGFIGSYLGAAVGASGSAISQQVVTSDKNDVIGCCRTERNGVQMCVVTGGDLTPAQYAGANGYRTLHRIGLLSRDKGCDMIIMEVSK